MPTTSTWFPGYQHFCLTWLKVWESSQSPPCTPCQVLWLTRVKEFRKILYLLLQFIINDTYEQPGEEAHRARSELRTLCPGEVVSHPPNTQICWKLLGPCLLGFLWRFHYISVIDQITDHWWLNLTPTPPSPPPIPPSSMEIGDGARISSRLIKVWSFCWPAPILKLPRGCQPSSVASLAYKKTFITLQIPRILAVVCHKTVQSPNIYFTISQLYLTELKCQFKWWNTYMLFHGIRKKAITSYLKMLIKYRP